MKKIACTFVACLAVASGAFAAHQTAATAEKKISSKNLPPAVKATVEAESKNATVKGISSEKEHGKIVYELETLVNGRTRDLMIDAAGKVYVVEEQVDGYNAPVPVRAAREGKGKVMARKEVQQNRRTTNKGHIQPKTVK